MSPYSFQVTHARSTAQAALLKPRRTDGISTIAELFSAPDNNIGTNSIPPFCRDMLVFPDDNTAREVTFQKCGAAPSESMAQQVTFQKGVWITDGVSEKVPQL